MKKKMLLIAMIGMCTILTGCSLVNRAKQEVPQEEYSEVGSAVKSEMKDDGTYVLTYALIGMKDQKIAYLYIDQIEKNLQNGDKSTFTNKELGTVYGLSYKSDHGEWNEQVESFENYVAGNHMTIEEVNDIPTDKNKNGKLIPEQGSDLEAGCELDIRDFLDVINQASKNCEKVKAIKLGMGDDICIYQNDNTIKVSLGFYATDYRYKICYSSIEEYAVIDEKGADVRSQKEKSSGQQDILEHCKQIDAFETYIQGKSLGEVANIEIYDPGNGVDTALPKPETDIAAVCNIDLSKYLSNAREASSRMA